MKFKFNPNHQYQLDAINSIVDIFDGQTPSKTNFEISLTEPRGLLQNDLGIGNRLDLIEDEILENLQRVQLRNGLPKSNHLDGMNFTVEMETGTGKTYVYTRTIFELNKKYGFTKFIIVVPSVAVREGVHKSLQVTEEHFKLLYDNVPYDYFIYSSDNLGQVRNFATSNNIQIMIINIQAFSKSFEDPEKEGKANIIHRHIDKMNGRKPIEFIQATNPIVIIDEPQSVDTTKKSKQAIESLNPLCTLRYSATHRDKYNLVYKLDAVDAYEKKLVKKIEVASIRSEESYNKPYIKLLEVSNNNGFKAKIEIDIKQGGKVKRVKRTIKTNDDLYDISGERELYRGYIVENINCTPGYESIEFINGDYIKLGNAIGDMNDDEVKRFQIRKTIETHLDKERSLNDKGIKVLSLFFIDKVSNYRKYDKNGSELKGKYAKMFEEEYMDLIKKPKYRNLFNYTDEKEITIDDVEKMHGGYFSIDNKGKIKDTRGNTKADEDTYSLIMKDKEKLLSFDTELRFIFSHSALREGWDNPNVFQICTLNETNSQIKKRQEVGRGLRLAVNQDGERVMGHEVNRLTIIANESYEDFARNLQREIEEEEGIKFGYIEKFSFSNILTDPDNEESYFGYENSEKVWNDLYERGYINEYGKIYDKLRQDLKINKVELSDEFIDLKQQIVSIIKKIAGDRKINISNAYDRKEVKLRKGILLDEKFLELWNRIKHKTTFRVDFDIEELKQRCVDKIKSMKKIDKPKFIIESAYTDITRGGVSTELVSETKADYSTYEIKLPDIITYLQNETNMTRRTIIDILTKCKRLEDFKNNPQRFMDTVSDIINKELSMMIVNGIKYKKINDEYYAMEVFKDDELYGYLGKNLIESTKGVYNHVIYDSNIEAEFAKKLEVNEAVKLYAKLPSSFVINTPIGTYNPDWAILIEEDNEEKLYFVVETKGTLDEYQLRETERAKIKCGKKHFEALNSGVKFKVTDTLENLL